MINSINLHAPFLVVINVGSSTIKMAIYQIGENKLIFIKRCSVERDISAFIESFKELISGYKGKIIAVAHRLVAVDSSLSTPAVISERMLSELIETEYLAPLHNPFSISIIKICQEIFAQHVLQTIHSDSEFFKELPDIASDYAVSKNISSHTDLVKKGFHGFAHKSMLLTLRKSIKTDKVLKRCGEFQKILTIQLGSGCSICAINNDSPIDISMGSSTNEGLIMSNRSGDVDTLAILKLLQDKTISIDQLVKELNQSSGLLGLTGSTGDMSQVTQGESKNYQDAINKYCYRIRKYMGAYVAVLGGVDCILIGGGVGKNSQLIRSKIFQDWHWLSMFHDEDNQRQINAKLNDISASGSKVKILVCDIDEEQLIAEDSFNLISEFYS